jgi:hypothetical protein
MLLLIAVSATVLLLLVPRGQVVHRVIARGDSSEPRPGKAIAVTALGLPLAYLYLPGLWRRVALLVSALAVAALSNGLRVAHEMADMVEKDLLAKRKLAVHFGYAGRLVHCKSSVQAINVRQMVKRCRPVYMRSSWIARIRPSPSSTCRSAP